VFCRECDERPADVRCHFCNMIYCGDCIAASDLCPNCFNYWTPDLLPELEGC
jgi:hypothetical protein